MASLRFGLLGGLFILMAPTVAQAAWKADDVVDPITDAKRPIRSVDAADGSSLVLKCDKLGKDQVYVDVISSRYLGAGRYRRRELTYRFDSAPPRNEYWSYDGRNVLAVKGIAGNVDAFIQEMSISTKLAIRATTYDNRTLDMVFDVTGAKDVIRDVYTSCADVSPIQP